MQETRELKAVSIAPAEGKLGILVVGLGAVSTTFIAGVEAIRRGFAKPIGSLSQIGHIRLGRRDENRQPFIKDVLPLATLDDIVFGSWDIFEDSAYEAAMHAGVIPEKILDQVKEPLQALKPMKAVFDRNYVKRLDGPNIKTGATWWDNVAELEKDIEDFKAKNGCTRVVMIFAASTEIYIPTGPVHQTLEAFEDAMKRRDPNISPTMVYAYTAIKNGIPFLNGTPNLSVGAPALQELARRTGSPIGGNDFKTGQTLMKTMIAPGLKARMLGLAGWYSTNILGNRDGEVLDDPESFKTKEVSKLSVLSTILQPDLYPDLYNDIHHVVRINYYPPRGDNKEGWDNIDIFGWLNMPMQIKVNFLCRDSILAAPLLLDLCLFGDLAKRAGMKGIQEWLSFFFKSPVSAPSVLPEHDLFIQQTKLKNTIRYLIGEPLVTHLGIEYYDLFS